MFHTKVPTLLSLSQAPTLWALTVLVYVAPESESGFASKKDCLGRYLLDISEMAMAQNWGPP